MTTFRCYILFTPRAVLSFYLSTQCMHVQQLHVAPVFTELILNSIRNECVRRRGGGGVVVVYGTRLLNYPHAATNSEKKNLKNKKNIFKRRVCSRY